MTMPASMDSLVADDARELRRGVYTASLGYALKLGMPVLLALATRAYGAERWGRFVSAQVLVLFAARLCLFGLDKALLWFVPQRGAEEGYRALLPAAMRVGLAAAAATCGTWLVAPWLPQLGAHAAVLRISVLGLVPLVLSELLLHATMGLRRMELQVMVRDTLNPLLQVLAALLLAQAGQRDLGLAWSYVISQCVGLGVAWLGFARLFRGVSRPPLQPLTLALPTGLARYAAPLWLAELGNSLLLRLDTLVLAALADPATVGVWAIVSQFANALRQIRRTYDPMVTAITARIAVGREGGRLTEAFSYAAQMVALSQLPVFAAFLVFADAVLPLYGVGFERGWVPLIVLSACFLASGGAGLAGLVVSGYGHARLALINVVFSLLIELLLLLLLVPRFALLGAALSVGLAVCATNVLQIVQMRAVTGAYHVTRRTRFTLLVTVSSITVLGAALLAGYALDAAPWTRRAFALLSFASAYSGLTVYGRRAGTLRAPGSTSTPASDPA